MWYDIYMKKTEMIETGSTGTVTISRAEYEEFQGAVSLRGGSFAIQKRHSGCTNPSACGKM